MITVYFKGSETHVLQTEIHPLGSGNWFANEQDLYMKEIETMLQDAVISKTLEELQKKRNRKKTTQNNIRKVLSKPIQVNGSMLRIAYSFEARNKCMDYVLLTNFSRNLSTKVCSAFEFLDEKLVVYAMPLEEFQRTLATSKKSHSVMFTNGQENDTNAISDYFEKRKGSSGSADNQKERLKAMLKEAKKKKKALSSVKNTVPTLEKSLNSKEELISNGVHTKWQLQEDSCSLDYNGIQDRVEERKVVEWNERETSEANSFDYVCPKCTKPSVDTNSNSYKPCDKHEKSISSQMREVDRSKVLNAKYSLLSPSKFESLTLVKEGRTHIQDCKDEKKEMNPVIFKKYSPSNSKKICNSVKNIALDVDAIHRQSESDKIKHASRKRKLYLDMFQADCLDPNSKAQCDKDGVSNDRTENLQNIFHGLDISPVRVRKCLSSHQIMEKNTELPLQPPDETKKNRKLKEFESNESFDIPAIHCRVRKESKRKYGLEMSSEDEDFAPLRRKTRKKTKAAEGESTKSKFEKTVDEHETIVRKTKTSTKAKNSSKFENVKGCKEVKGMSGMKTNTADIAGATLLKTKQTELFFEKCKQKLNETITKFNCDNGDFVDVQKLSIKRNRTGDCVLTHVDENDCKLNSEGSQDPEDIFSDCFIMEELSNCNWTPGKVNTDLEREIDQIKAVSDLNEKQLQYIVTKNEPYLRQIFQGKMKNKRHDEYKKGGKARANLMYQINIGLFKEHQHDAVMEALIRMFCKRHNKYFDYIIKVMLPEILIKIYMDVNDMSHEATETVMNKALNTMGAIFV